MKIATRENIVPGRDAAERFHKAAQMGFEAIDLGWQDDMWERASEVKAASQASGLPISSVSCGPNNLLAPTPDERAQCVDLMVRLLELAEDLGAIGSVCVPVRPSVRFPDLSPVYSVNELVTQLSVKMLREVLRRTQGLNAVILLEPLNRYESYYLRTLADGVELCQMVGDARVAIVADFFHMGLEEADIAASIRSAHKWIRHVHLGDSNRLLPGQGHTDFVSGFAALREIGYEGFMALECGVGGDPDAELPKSVKLMRSWM
jgi:sugar phosphate isomerase/epimerase